MHCPIVLIFLIFAILLQYLNASFKLSSATTGGFRELQDANIKSRAVQDVPAVDAATRDLAASKPKRVIMVDNGGVLTSQPMPSQEELAKIIRILKKLTQDGRNEVWIMTARTPDSVKRLYGEIPGLHLAGEMGTLVDKSEIEYFKAFEYMRSQIDSIHNNLLKLLSQDDGKGSAIRLDMLTNSIIIHYGTTSGKEKETAEFLQKARKILDKDTFKDYRILNRPYPDRNLAILSHRDCHKGTLAGLLMAKHKATPGGALFLSIGDHPVDEQMFGTLRAMEATETTHTPNSNFYLPILVHDPEKATNAEQNEPRMTAAHRNLKDSSEVLDFLDGLSPDLV